MNDPTDKEIREPQKQVAREKNRRQRENNSLTKIEQEQMERTQ